LQGLHLTLRDGGVIEDARAAVQLMLDEVDEYRALPRAEREQEPWRGRRLAPRGRRAAVVARLATCDSLDTVDYEVGNSLLWWKIEHIGYSSPGSTKVGTACSTGGARTARLHSRPLPWTGAFARVSPPIPWSAAVLQASA
jgi:hypothetical protein